MSDPIKPSEQLSEDILWSIYWLLERGEVGKARELFVEHARYEGKTAEQWAELAKTWEAEAAGVGLRAEAAEAKALELEKVTEHLRILDSQTGEEFKSIFAKARKSPVYWTEAVELLQERIAELEAERANAAVYSESIERKMQAEALREAYRRGYAGEGAERFAAAIERGEVAIAG